MTWCEEGKPQQAAGARLFGQRLHWQLVCSAAPGISGLTATRCRARCRVFIDVLTYWRYLHHLTSIYISIWCRASSWQLLTGWLAKIHQHSRYAEVVICLLELKTSQRQMTALSRQLFRRGPKKYGVWCVWCVCIFKFIQDIPQRCELLAPHGSTACIHKSRPLSISEFQQVNAYRLTFSSWIPCHSFHLFPAFPTYRSLWWSMMVCDFWGIPCRGLGQPNQLSPFLRQFPWWSCLAFLGEFGEFTTQAGHGWPWLAIIYNDD